MVLAVWARSCLVMRIPYLFDADDIGDPALDVFVGGAAAEGFVGFAFFVEIVEIGVAFFEAGFVHDFLDFGEGPEAPFIGEGAGIFFDAGDAEVNMAGGVVVDGVIGGLVPDVFEVGHGEAVGGGEGGDFADVVFFDGDGFGAAVDIEDEVSVFFEAFVDVLEIGEELAALFEDAEGEVEGEGDIGFGGGGGEDVLAAELEAFLLGGFEGGDVVVLAPVEGGLVEVDAGGVVGFFALNPAGGELGGAAEVFADVGGFAVVVAFVDAAGEVEVGVDVLDGGFV